jgi:predicted cobalt transporter CbtA
MIRIILAILAVFVAWSALDFIMHGVILAAAYQATAQLWRPMNQMKMTVLHVTTLIAAIVFVILYVRLISPRNVIRGLEYGLLFGLAAGVSMGFGTYSVMPVPLYMAIVWLVGSIVEMALGGIIVGAMIQEESALKKFFGR